MSTRGWEGVELAGLVRAGAAPNSPQRRKYRNVAVEIEGLRFDSRAEGDYWLKLRDREARGEIYELRRQVAFPLYTVARTARSATGQRQRDILVQVAEYVADFVYLEAGERHVVDVKRRQTQTPVYRLKRKFLELQDGIVIEEVSG